MKRILALLFLGIVFMGCSKDEDKEDIQSSKFLIGKWEAIEYYDDEDENGIYPYEPNEKQLIFTDNRATYYEYGDEVISYKFEYFPSSKQVDIGGYMLDVTIHSTDRIELRMNTTGSLYKRI